jgi:hypothetical protein
MLQGIISCLHLLDHILPIKIDALVRTRSHIIPSEGWGFTSLIVEKEKKKKSSIDWHNIMYI